MSNVVLGFFSKLAILLYCCLIQNVAIAGPREQAKRMHDRLVGTPPSAATLDLMAQRITAGQAREAANLAMQNPAFYNTFLKNWVTPWTNTDQTSLAPLNDYTAMVVGMIRDDVPFNQVLSGDIMYITNASGAPAYNQANNDHYEYIENNRIDMSNAGVFVRTTQSGLPGSVLTPQATAGVITSRAAASAYFSAGTNRRMWRYIAMNFLCRDMEDLSDTTRVPDRVRQDVTRSSGGDSRLWLNYCVGCHSGMDPLVGAFAYYEFDDETQSLVYSPGVVQNKFLINANTFSSGYITIDDSWSNYWRDGPNRALGWRDPASTAGASPARLITGNGAKSLGEEVARSRVFSTCQVRKAFEKVCLRPAFTSVDMDNVNNIANIFESNNYNMKRVFAELAVLCMGN